MIIWSAGQLECDHSSSCPWAWWSWMDPLARCKSITRIPTKIPTKSITKITTKGITKIITIKTMTMINPGYPDPSSPATICSWALAAPPGYLIRFQLSSPRPSRRLHCHTTILQLQKIFVYAGLVSSIPMAIQASRLDPPWGSYTLPIPQFFLTSFKGGVNPMFKNFVANILLF